MATKAQCHEYAAENGFEIDDWDDTISVCMPKGMVDSEGLHERVVSCDQGRHGAWRAVMRELKIDVQLCTVTDCEWCVA